MRITTPEVVWHGGEAGKNDPILSVDVHPCGVLATGGADGEVRFWRLRLEENEESKFQEYLYSFENHEKSVNVVRFSPDGRTLATASDGGLIILFRLDEGKPVNYWRKPQAARKVKGVIVRTAQADIYDVAWAPSALEFASVSVDNRVCFWQIQGSGNAAKAYPVTTFTSHQNYVQGVAWDPRDRFIVSQSNDRSCRVYKRREDAKGKGKGGKKSKKNRLGGPPFTEVSLMRLASRPEDAGKAKEEETCCIVAAKVSSPGGARRRVDDEDDSDDEDEEEARPAAAASATSGSSSTSSSSAAANAQDGNEAASAQASAPAAPATTKRAPRANLFADETIPSFFRRPAWSPDGCLLLTPAGIHKRPDGSSSSSGGAGGKTEYATHVYSRTSFAMPVLELPHPGCKASVAVRFCPQVFELKPPAGAAAAGAAAASASSASEEGKAEPGLVAITPPPPLTNLPYRMVFAVVTVSGVLVYDTQHHYPLAFVKNSHYAPLTDVAWLSDGRALVTTSMDGYVSVLSFPDDELGAPLELEKVPLPARAMYKAYYDGVLHAAEGEKEERAEEEERRARLERKALAKAEKKAAKKEAKARRQEEEAAAGGGDGDGEESTAASTSSGGSAGSSSSSSKAASRASLPKTRGGGRGGKTAGDGGSVMSLLDEESSEEEVEMEEEEEEAGSKSESKKEKKAARRGKGDSDGESLNSEAMSEDEEEEDEEGSTGAAKWERVVEGEEEAAASPAKSSGSGGGGSKKRDSSEMAHGQDDDDDDEEEEEGLAPTAAAAAAAASASESKQLPAQQPAAPAGAAGKKKAAKRIKPTLISTEPLGAPSPQSSPASSAASLSLGASENRKPVATNIMAPAAAKADAAAAAAGAPAAAPAAKAKKRVAPTLVSSKVN